MSFKRLLYTVFVYFIFPLVLLRLLIRGKSNPAYLKRWSERFGFIKTNKLSPVIWVHAVSVGETIAAKPLIENLLSTYPESPILVTTTTPTGSDRVNEMFAAEIKVKQIIHTYFPYDLLSSVSRFVSVFKPKILIVVETEIWPNLYAQCHQQQIPIVIINARLSEKSTQSYLKIKGLVSETLSKVNVIAVRSQVDAERFKMLGARLDQIQESGNIKYDISVDQKQLERGVKYLKLFNANRSERRLVFVAASTHRKEDEKILLSYLNLLEKFPNLLLIIVPRHPERFDEVYEKSCELLPKSVNIFRQSQGGISNFDDRKFSVILGDSMGEMQMWYATADVVFIGGSLVDVGGHNPLEATIFGVPVVSGPHMFNFDDMAVDLSDEELLFVCDNENEITEKISQLLSVKKIDSNYIDYVTKANEFMQQHQGVTARLMKSISRLF